MQYAKASVQGLPFLPSMGLGAGLAAPLTLLMDFAIRAYTSRDTSTLDQDLEAALMVQQQQQGEQRASGEQGGALSSLHAGSADDRDRLWERLSPRSGDVHVGSPAARPDAASVTSGGVTDANDPKHLWRMAFVVAFASGVVWNVGNACSIVATNKVRPWRSACSLLLKVVQRRATLFSKKWQ